MTTAAKLQEREEMMTALYCRLSVDDIKEDAGSYSTPTVRGNRTCCCSVGTYDIQLKFYAFFDFFRSYRLTISNINVNLTEF